MKIHILGICGTFMGSLAVLAKQLGHEVSGCDAHVYPPMSTQLKQQGINLMGGYDPAHLQGDNTPDLVIVGNAMSRGNPCVEYVLNQRLNYTSGPQWLCDHVLKDRWVLAVAGTHGKTTTATMLTWILKQANMKPGYLIGGVPLSKHDDKRGDDGGSEKELTQSADLGDSIFFVIEADEYDSAFFDKRSKFIHYRPRTVILNNLEFDHADIFDSIEDIQKQFHHLVRTIPSEGRIISPTDDKNLQTVLEKGCWSEKENLSASELSEKNNTQGWSFKKIKKDGSEFSVFLNRELQGNINWAHTGQHNINNGLAAIAAARHVGVSPEHAIEALNSFNGVKRRMEKIYQSESVIIYDDFAHHPSAIKTTLEGLRKKIESDGSKNRVIAVIEPRSNTMRLGIHKENLAASASEADEALWYKPKEVSWDLQALLSRSENTQTVCENIDDIASTLLAYVQATSDSKNKAVRLHIVIMSNGGFGGLQQTLLKKLN